MTAIIETEKLTKYYGPHRGIIDVDLQVAEAEAFAAEFTALPGVSDVAVEDHTLRMRVAGSITPVVQAAARHELLDFLSREPSLEETFLAEYGPGAAEVASR